jgi:outer membrane biosynthesis protein TonB
MKSILAIIAALWCINASAAPTNFVLLVECSPRMALRKESIIDIARELISSGVDERVRSGEIFEVWFYDESLQADAVRIPWDPKRSKIFGDYTAERIRAKRFDAPGNLTIAYPSLRTLLKNSGELTAFILTDGFQPFAGTPFDEQINKKIAANRDAFYQGNEPFLITLLGRQGQWIVGDVHAKLNTSIDIPEFPKPPAPEPKVAIPKPEEKTTPPIQVATITTPPAQPIPEPAPAKQPEPKQEPELKKEPVIETPAPVVQAKVEEPKPQPRKASEPITSPSELKSPEPIPTQVPTPVPDSAEPQPIQAVATPTQPTSFPWPILLAIFGLIAAGGIFVYTRIKDRPATETTSLISQAYNASIDPNLPRLPISPGTRLKINLPPANPPIQQERPEGQQSRDEHQP